LLEGKEFKQSYWGDNSMVVPTDTIRNTLYVLAQKAPIQSVEAFGLMIVKHFLDQYTHVEKVDVVISENSWKRIKLTDCPNDQGHDHSFEKAGSGLRTAHVSSERGGNPSVTSGMKDVCVLKSTASGFEGFHKDKFTVLPEVRDRIFSTLITATWTYNPCINLGAVDYNRIWDTAKQAFLKVFAGHYSRSVQETLKEMGEALLRNVLEVEQVSLVLPNRHYLPFDLTRFGEPASTSFCVFQPTDDPAGWIEGTIARSVTHVPVNAHL